MSLDRAQPNAQPLSSVDELVGFFRAAERPIARHWVGLEHEKFIYPNGSTEPVPYEGERGISAVLKGLQAFRFQPFRESPSGPVIALTRGKSNISPESARSPGPWGFHRTAETDRKSTRPKSSHHIISHSIFFLQKKKPSTDS